MGVLPKEFYDRPVQQVARQLLGKRLVTRINGQKVAGVIVETEAYLPTADSACHGTRGKTTSNAAMFGPPGIAYVYPIHSRFCFNVVTAPTAQASAVLIRAVKPTDGLKWMMERRQNRDIRELASGPSKLCQAFAIDRGLDHQAIFIRRFIWIDDVNEQPVADSDIRKTRRIGVTSAQHRLLRFVIKSHPFASGPKSWR